eukprot:8286782-Pyramimonas_sp.AAC.1
MVRSKPSIMCDGFAASRVFPRGCPMRFGSPQLLGALNRVCYRLARCLKLVRDPRRRGGCG